MGEPAQKLEVVRTVKGKKSKGVDAFADALSTTKAVPKDKKKSKMTILEAPDMIRATVDRYLEAKEAEKVATAEKENAGDALIEFVRPFQDADGYKGSFRHSYAIPGTNGKQVKYVSSNRFSISPEDHAELEDLLGDDFDEMIEVKHSVSLKDAVFEDEKLQGELMALVGENFARFFETKTSLKAKDEFDRRIYQVLSKDQLPALRTFARPYKPSLRA